MLSQKYNKNDGTATTKEIIALLGSYAGLAVKNAYHSCKGLEFGSQHQHINAYNSSSKESSPLWPRDTCMHVVHTNLPQHRHIKINSKKKKGQTLMD